MNASASGGGGERVCLYVWGGGYRWKPMSAHPGTRHSSVAEPVGDRCERVLCGATCGIVLGVCEWALWVRVLCCAVCYVVLCCVVLCCAALCCAVGGDGKWVAARSAKRRHPSPTPEASTAASRVASKKNAEFGVLNLQETDRGNAAAGMELISAAGSTLWRSEGGGGGRSANRGVAWGGCGCGEG